MNKMPFHWKTILNGFIVLLALGTGFQSQVVVCATDSFGHDVYLSSFNATDSDAVAATSPWMPHQEPSLPSTGECCMPCGNSNEFTSAELGGIFLHRMNNSPVATVGSCFLGPGAFFLNGYIDQGLTYGSSDTYQTPAAMNDERGYQMNQLYLSFGRNVVKGQQFSVGGRIDVIYGTDYYYMVSAGLENRPDNAVHWNPEGDDIAYRAGRSQYGFALPQAYGEFYAPIGEGIDIKVGHFYSVMGYESLENNRNFFYSRSYSRLYGMPTSMTGVIGELGLGSGWSMLLGAVNEWNAFDTPNDSFSGVFGLNYKSRNGFFTFATTAMYGEQHAPCYQFQTYSDDATDTFVVNAFMKFQFTQRLAYVCEFTAGYDDREYFCVDTFSNNRGRAWYGLTNYLFYKVCDQLTLGTRFEWFNDADNTVIDGGYGMSFIDDATNYYALTFGANWTPVSWISVRPEVRYDFSDFEYEGIQTYDNWSSDYQLTVGADMIIRF